MQEIAPGVYFEDSYIGVTLGAISLPHGLLLIDAPPRAEDQKAWRTTLQVLGGGVDRLLIHLDPHFDRTLGSRGMECTVVAHEHTAQVFRNRPTTFKAQVTETGAEWELANGLASVRWALPEITFTHHLAIHWDASPALVDSRPGPNPGAVWVTLPREHVVFLGDAVTPNQPPFLSSADLPAWIAMLQPLLEDSWKDTLMVSGRAGLVTQKDVRRQIEMLEQIHARMEEANAARRAPDANDPLINDLLNGFKIPAGRKKMYTQRFTWGVNRYYTRHYGSGGDEFED